MTTPTPEALAEKINEEICEAYGGNVEAMYRQGRLLGVFREHYATILAKLNQLKQERDGLREALKFYAGTIREDGNGYEFQKETYTGATARAALTQPTTGEWNKLLGERDGLREKADLITWLLHYAQGHEDSGAPQIARDIRDAVARHTAGK
jgi:hypothetical protein